ncbi:hypothetical protein M1O56_00410 [Dehalococcoidia bacterium]|nr:hypothetical protein [Dehalococcoidia bacterium]
MRVGEVVRLRVENIDGEGRLLHVMRFLVDENLPRSTGDLLRRCGHEVVLKLPRMATASFILNLLESFLQQKDLVAQISGKLAIVEPGRIRIRTA